jgi:hypothetical protein
VSKRVQLVALAVGIGVSGGLAYLLYRKTFIRYLYISTGEGGTTDPPPGVYTKKLNEQVTITAVPDEGYTYGTWTVDGVDYGHVPSITVTMDANHTVICTFWKGGVPPPTYPVNLIPLGTIDVLSNIGAKVINSKTDDRYRPGYICFTYNHYDADWNIGYTEVPIKFQAVDSAGRGVPDIDIAMWTETIQDQSKYQGIILLNRKKTTMQAPVIVKTDSQGIAQAKVAYLYGLNDNYKTICGDAKMGISQETPSGSLNWTCPDYCYDTFCLDTPYYFTTIGGGRSGIELPPQWLHRIYAQIVGTAITTSEYARCGFNIRWV